MTRGSALHLASLATAVVLATAGCGGGGGRTHGSDGPGNGARGRRLFATNCASCHGVAGKGGTAPKLKGASLGPEEVRARIDDGASGMPAGLVTGRDENDVVAYVSTLLAAAS